MPFTKSLNLSAACPQSKSVKNPIIKSPMMVSFCTSDAPIMLKSISAIALFKNSAILLPIFVKLMVSNVQYLVLNQALMA